MTTVLVTGARNYNGDLSDHFDELDILRTSLQLSDYVTVIHGGATGVDTNAGKESKKRGWAVQVFPADWKSHGKAAGPIRNASMIQQRPHLAVAVLYPDSIGTRNCLKQLADSTTKNNSRLQYCLVVDLETGSARWLNPEQLYQEYA